MATPPSRTAAAYAIEHAEYMAKAAEAYLEAINALLAVDNADDSDMFIDTDAERERALEVAHDRARALRNDIGEFRKRAQRVQRV